MERVRADNNQQMALIVKELDRQKDTRKDLVVNSQVLKAVPEPETIVLDIPRYGGHPLTDWAHGQVAAKLDIPYRYYEKMLKNKQSDLLAHNINTWLPNQGQKLIRILDGKVRAFLSDRYKVLDNHDMAFMAMNEFMKEGAAIHRADLTEQHMFIKATTPRIQAEVVPGDVVEAGVIIRNSEVGASRFAVEPFVLRLRCKNGMVVNEGYSRVHLGKRQDEGEIEWSDNTLNLENQYIWSSVKDVIHNVFNPDKFSELVNRFKGAAHVKIDAPVQAVDNVVSFAKFSELDKDAILEAFLGEKDYTQWGMVNGITAVARDVEVPEVQVTMESKATDIALMPADEFLDLVNAKPKKSQAQRKPESNGGAQ